jgi:hypothetical protein
MSVNDWSKVCTEQLELEGNCVLCLKCLSCIVVQFYLNICQLTELGFWDLVANCWPCLSAQLSSCSLQVVIVGHRTQDSSNASHAGRRLFWARDASVQAQRTCTAVFLTRGVYTANPYSPSR